jgi:hypothetical protein
MSDMLVKLYDLPQAEPVLAGIAEHGIDIRRAIAPEKSSGSASISANTG